MSLYCTQDDQVTEKLISILKERSAAQPAYMRRFTDNHPLKLAAWVPYFDHMDAIIFLAPIRCAFGVKLDYFNSQSWWSTPKCLRSNIGRGPESEPPGLSSNPVPLGYKYWPVSQQQDSIQLWKEIVPNGLLKNTNIILFLNKIDIFRTKLESGVRFSDYVTSYGDRPNNFESISTCEFFPLLYSSPQLT